MAAKRCQRGKPWEASRQRARAVQRRRGRRRRKGKEQWRGSTAAFSAVIHPHEKASEEAVSLTRPNTHILPEVQCHNNDEQCIAIISLARARTRTWRAVGICVFPNSHEEQRDLRGNDTNDELSPSVCAEVKKKTSIKDEDGHTGSLPASRGLVCMLGNVQRPRCWNHCYQLSLCWHATCGFILDELSLSVLCFCIICSWNQDYKLILGLNLLFWWIHDLWLFFYSHSSQKFWVWYCS